MHAQRHDDEEEEGEKMGEDESRPLLVPSGELSRSSRTTKRTGLLWSACAAADSSNPALSGPACSSSARCNAAAGSGCCRGTRSFVPDLSMLVRVFFVRGLFLEQRWLFPLVLACSAVSYEVAASTILSVISDFYLAISSMDAQLFLQASRFSPAGWPTPPPLAGFVLHILLDVARPPRIRHIRAASSN